MYGATLEVEDKGTACGEGTAPLLRGSSNIRQYDRGGKKKKREGFGWGEGG